VTGARPLIALSTASVFPEPLSYAFEVAARLGYDGVELMPLTDTASQDVDTVRGLSDGYALPVLSVHAPCLLVTQRVWGVNPWRKLVKARRVAERLGASTVVVHPPFRWQRDYARRFVDGLERLGDVTDVRFAVENMYPWTARKREIAAYLPDWDPRSEDYPHVTLDLSHTSASGSDALEMAADLGDRLAHVHIADGTGIHGRDEHLVPGRGTQPCAELLQGLAAGGFTGTVVVEISTRKCRSRHERENDLADALGFTRRHLLNGPAPSSGS
jgi:sugar phosphate isomerase/epimerase